MFGYVRPNKGELLVREFSRFRTVYCGICKEIGRSYGQLPRVALTYDITMLGLLLISLSEENPKEEMERCILNPVQKRPMLAHNEILHRCAALSVLLAYGKFADETQDGRPVVGNAGKLLLKRASQKATKDYPAEAAAIAGGLKKLRETELSDMKKKRDAAGDETGKTCEETQKSGSEPVYETSASLFGEILQTIFKESFSSYFSDEKYKDSLLAGIARMGFHLGRWIFIMDAVDDYEQDAKTKNWNPFLGMSTENIRGTAWEMLLENEKQLDQVAALLPYKRDANIVCNIVQDGLPTTRQRVFLHQKLGRL